MKNKDISPGLDAVILKCLEKDPKLRYQSANDLLEDLKELARGSGPHRPVAVRPAPDSRAKRWLIAGLVLIVALAAGMVYRNRLLEWIGVRRSPVEQKIMAVLPIDAVGQDPSTSALGLGLTETVTAKLVQASNSDAIQVVSPRDLRDRGVKTAEDARREYGTDLVLECSLQRSGQMIRINCYLVDSKTHRQLAAKSIEAEVTDAFGLQDRVLSAALDMLPTQIKPEERRKLNVNQDTQPAAYEAYIRGRGYLQEYEKPENIDSAITEFEGVIQVDPKYAPAYAGLGEAYWIGYQQPMNRGNQWLMKASQNCGKALELSPQLAEGHTCLGNVSLGTGKYEDAVKQYQRALQLDPGSDYALGQLADAYQRLGNPKAAESAYRHAIALRPNYWGVYSGLGALFYGQARYSEAAEMFRKVIELAPDNYHGYSNLGAMYLYLGRYSDAIAASMRSIEVRPNRDAYTNLGAVYFAQRRFAEAAEASRLSLKLDNNDPLNWGNLADALYWTPGHGAEAVGAYRKAISLYQAKLEVNPKDAEALGYTAMYSAMLGDKEKAVASLQKVLAIAADDPEVRFKAAYVYSHLGETDQSLSWLKKALDAGYPKSIVKDTPEFDHFRSNPTYQALIG